MEGKEVFDGRDAARARGQLPDTVVLAGQDLHVVICQEKREKVSELRGMVTMPRQGQTEVKIPELK